MKFNLPHHSVLFKTYRSTQKEKKNLQNLCHFFCWCCRCCYNCRHCFSNPECTHMNIARWLHWTPEIQHHSPELGEVEQRLKQHQQNSMFTLPTKRLINTTLGARPFLLIHLFPPPSPHTIMTQGAILFPLIHPSCTNPPPPPLFRFHWRQICLWFIADRCLSSTPVGWKPRVHSL